MTNDDGINANGLNALCSTVSQYADIVVVAPSSQRSACSHAVTLHDPIRMNKLGDMRFSLTGTPVDCVIIGMNKILQHKPDFIFSGINHGSNIGDDVHYSATVSAAYEGALKGIPSIAFSHMSSDVSHTFESEKKWIDTIAKWFLNATLPANIMINVNIPDVPASEIKGISVASLGKREYKDMLDERKDPQDNSYFWLGGEIFDKDVTPQSDCFAISQKKITITPLKTDITNYEQMEMVSSSLEKGILE